MSVQTIIAAGAVLLAGCSSRPPGRTSRPSADALVAPWVPLRFGDPIERARADLPDLTPSGWQEGSRATFVAPHHQAGLEVETDAGRVCAVALTFGPERAAEVEQDLRSRLGPGVECAALPEGISSFRPTLWRTDDGAAVSLVRKRQIVQLRVERPASSAFEEAFRACGR